METKRNQRSQRSQTELSGTASAASGNLPWVRADKKSSVNARTRPLGMMSGELSVPDQSGTEASGSWRTFPQKPPVGSTSVWKLLTLPRVVGGEQQVVARARHSTRRRA
jgi:hypothetical protein